MERSRCLTVTLYLQDAVAIFHYGRAMGNEDDGLAMRGKEILQELTFGLRVERTGSLIEEHDAAIAQKTPGDGYALGLPLA